MDLRVYYQKIREIEATLAEPSVVVVSHDTPEGGKAGVRTEVSRYAAAKLVVEGKARLASEEERRDLHEQNSEAKRIAEQLAAASRMQVTIVPNSELRLLRTKGSKE